MASEPTSSAAEKPESPPQALSLSRHASAESDATHTDPDEKFALGRKGILVVFTLCVLTLMAALDGTSISVALPVITSIFGSPPVNFELTHCRSWPKNSTAPPSKPSGQGLRSCSAPQVRHGIGYSLVTSS